MDSKAAESAKPTKCMHCSKPMSTPLLCDYCETLNPLPNMTDHFQLLGLSRRFDLDDKALHDSYLALSRHTHPDYHAGQSAEVQALAQTVSAAVNEAYRTLFAPVRRASYLLELVGGASSAQEKGVPDGFLSQMMMLQEEVEDAKLAHDQAALARLGQVLHTQQDGLMRRVAALFGELEAASACEATRQAMLAEIRQQLNAVSYVRKLLSQT